FEAERLGVDHDDATVAVAVRDIELVVDGIDGEVGGATEVGGVGRAGALALTAELRQELALRGELENLVVLFAAACKPHVVLGIDKDAVLDRGPFVALTRAAPRGQELAVLIER